MMSKLLINTRLASQFIPGSSCAGKINKFVKQWETELLSTDSLVFALMKQQSAHYHRETLCLQMVGGYIAAGRLGHCDSHHKSTLLVKLQPGPSSWPSSWLSASWHFPTSPFSLGVGLEAKLIVKSLHVLYTHGRDIVFVVKVHQGTHSCRTNLIVSTVWVRL